MSDTDLYKVFTVIWTGAALYSSYLAGALHRRAVENEQARTKNGIRKVLSQGSIRLYRILFAKALIYLFAGVLALTTVPGAARLEITVAVILGILLLVLLLNRANRQDQIVEHYDLREDRADARAARAEDRADARADRAEERADQREFRKSDSGGSGGASQ